MPSTAPPSSVWEPDDASTATFAAAMARLTALEAELRAKDVALRTSKAQCAHLSIACAGLRRQLDAAELRLAEGAAPAEAASRAAAAVLSPRSEGLRAGARAAAAASAGRVATSMASRAEAEELRAVILLWHTWVSTSRASAASSAAAASKLVVEARQQAQGLAAQHAEAAAAARRALASAEARERAVRQELEVARTAAVASSAARSAGRRAARLAALGLFGNAVDRSWRSWRLLVFEAWRRQARDSHQLRLRTGLEEQRKARDAALEFAVHALLGATQDAWWLHTVVGAWKVLVCAQALERVCSGVTAGAVQCNPRTLALAPAGSGSR
uniref:Uncharacterized protein n=1 Tax=Alexandrium monilatum TaxID=311494 RepID=A0A7S4QAT8_9DINO